MKTNQVWKASQVFINNAPSRWIVTDKIWKGNVIADCADMESASRIAKALNEHAALVAVAEALQGIAPKLARWKSTGIEAGKMGKDCNFEQLQSLVEKTLANLTTVREGGAK